MTHEEIIKALVEALEGCLQMMAVCSCEHPTIQFGTDEAIKALNLAKGEK